MLALRKLLQPYEAAGYVDKNAMSVIMKYLNKSDIFVILVAFRMKRLKFPPKFLRIAAKNSHFALVKWASRHKCPSEFAIDGAVESGHFKIIRWLYYAGRCQWRTHTTRLAVRSGNLKIVKWLRMRGCPWHVSVCETAARHGHLDVLKWALRNGAVFNENVYISAVHGGHLNIVKWLHAKKYPHGQSLIGHAAKCGHAEIHIWLLFNL